MDILLYYIIFWLIKKNIIFLISVKDVKMILIKKRKEYHSTLINIIYHLLLLCYDYYSCFHYKTLIFVGMTKENKIRGKVYSQQEGTIRHKQ